MGNIQTFAHRVIEYTKSLRYTGKPLPAGIRVMNPFTEPQTMRIVTEFYNKYYNDNHQRHVILGINPGRFGGALTGIPFTDPKRLVSELGINYPGKPTHEPSSVFVYEMIKAYGGPEAFYNDFYINSLCPLGFTSVDDRGNEKNYNFYDSPELQNAVYDYMVANVQQQIALSIDTNVCFCFGTGKNEKVLSKLNAKYGFFKKIIALEHPRFIMQYKFKNKQFYIDKYLEAFSSIKQF